MKKGNKKILLISFFAVIAVVISFMTATGVLADFIKDIKPKRMENETADLSGKYSASLTKYDNGFEFIDNRPDVSGASGNVCFEFNLKPGYYYWLYYGYMDFNDSGATLNGLSDGCGITDNSSKEVKSRCISNKYLINENNRYSDLGTTQRFGWLYPECDTSKGHDCRVQPDNTKRKFCVTLPSSNEVDLYFTLQVYEHTKTCDELGSDGTCVKYNEYYPSNKLSYSQQWVFNIPPKTSTILSYEIDNPDLALCNEYIKDLNASEVSQLQQIVPYCFSQKVAYNENDTELRRILANSIRYIRGKDNVVTLPVVNAQKVDSTSLTSILKCDPFSERETTKSYYYTEQDNYYISEETKNYYISNGQNISSTLACTSECREVITISYGPPSSVKAGTCFESEVTVRSNVECTSTPKLKPPEAPRATSIRIPIPTCSGESSWHIAQAGPNEDFDQCIKSCDGGKYTQECIDSCYGNVYEDNVVQNNISNNDLRLSFAKKNSSNIQRLTNEESGNSVISTISSTCPVASNYNNFESFYTAVYNYFYDNSGRFAFRGHFTRDNGYVQWVPDAGCYWNKYSPYYLQHNTLRRTVGSDFYTFQAGMGRYWGADTRQYRPDSNGIKRESYSSYGFACGQSCWYYNYDNTSFGKPGAVTDQQYQEAMTDWNNVMDGCSNKNVCEENVANFTISVANDNFESSMNPEDLSGKVIQACGSDTSGDSSRFKSSSCFSWNSTLNQNSGAVTGDSLIFKELDSYCTTDNSALDDYYAKVSFPGSWVNNKNGVIEFEPPKDELFYKKEGNKYCIDRGFGNVNKAWWNWYNYGRLIDEENASNADKEAAEIAKSKIDPDSLFYNILTTVSDFGKYKWNFEVACFFASSTDQGCGPSSPHYPNCNNGGPPNDGRPDGEDYVCPEDDPCCNGSCGEIAINNFKSRAASLNNLFVGANIEGVDFTLSKFKNMSLLKLDDSNKQNYLRPTRLTRFNWDYKATDLSLTGYAIAPSAAIAMIQGMGNDVYNREEELDYSITITPAQMRAIRRYSSDDANNKYASSYINWSGTFTLDESNGIDFYRSSLLRDNKYATLNKSPSTVGCNNLISGSCNLDYNGYARNTEFVPGIMLGNQKAFYNSK